MSRLPEQLSTKTGEAQLEQGLRALDVLEGAAAGGEGCGCAHAGGSAGSGGDVRVMGSGAATAARWQHWSAKGAGVGRQRPLPSR